MPEPDEEMIPAIPPMGFEGSFADWIIGLVECGYMDEGGYYGDVMLSVEQYSELLDTCEETLDA